MFWKKLQTMIFHTRGGKSKPRYVIPGEESSKPRYVPPGEESSKPRYVTPGEDSSKPRYVTPGEESSKPCLFRILMYFRSVINITRVENEG